MKKYKNYINLFNYQFLLNIITIIVGIPLYKLFSLFLKKVYNLEYLSLRSVLELFHHISFILIVLFIVYVLSLFLIYNISSSILLLNNRKNFVREGLNKVKDILTSRNILYILFPIPLYLFFNIGLFVLSYLYIDRFNLLINVLTHNITLLVISIIITIIDLFILITGLKLFNKYVLESIPFNQAIKTINIKDNLILLVKLLLKKTIPFIIIYLISNLLSNIFFNIRLTNNSFIEGIIVSLFIISLLAYIIFEVSSDICLLSDYQLKAYYNKKLFKINTIIIIAINIIMILVMYLYNKGIIKYTFIYDYNVSITAHRGASSYAPENTFASFNKAIELGVDYIELDVNITKDNVLYVMHDTNFNRLLGLNKKASEVKWKDIKDMKVISSFDEYKDEKIPLFEDVLKWYKDKNVLLNIELKMTNESILLPDKVVELIHKYKIENRCVIASFDTNAILRVKELDSKLNIVYLGYEYCNDTRIDNYSINYASITPNMVERIHNNHKKIYAWTINDPDIVKTMLNVGVDSIITNDPIMVKNVIADYKDKNKVNVLFNFILSII